MKATALRWVRVLATAAGAAALLAAPALLPLFYLEYVTEMAIFGVFVMSLDLVWGYAGLLVLGHAAFFGWGAYAVGYLSVKLGVTSLVLTLLAAALTGFVLSALLGLFLFMGRRRIPEIYFAMATFVLAYASERLASNWSEIGAANGIPSIPLPTLGFGLSSGPELEAGAPTYYLALGLALATLFALRGLMRSQFGLVLSASKGNAQRTSFLGYDLKAYRLLVFTLSGALAGLAGGAYAFENGFVSPSLTGYALSTKVALWLLLGGAGTLWGGVVGVALFQYSSLVLASVYPFVWQMLVGVILVGIVAFLPNGLAGLVVAEDARQWRYSRIGRRRT